ncbi:MAG: TetR/AcrR family transcriptional regulator [Actinomycetota bacterium]
MGSNGKRDQIVNAGAKVFAKVGYHKATVEDILGEAGAARSTFYSYFSSKRDVFTAAVSGIMEDILAILAPGIDDAIARFTAPDLPPPDEAELERRLAAIMTDVFHYIAKNRSMTKVFLHELVGVDDEMTALFIDFQERVTDQFERLIVFGEGIGIVRDLSARRAAEFVVGGLIHLGRNLSAGLWKNDIEGVSAGFVDLQLNGLLVRG